MNHRKKSFQSFTSPKNIKVKLLHERSKSNLINAQIFKDQIEKQRSKNTKLSFKITQSQENKFKIDGQDKHNNKKTNKKNSPQQCSIYLLKKQELASIVLKLRQELATIKNQVQLLKQEKQNLKNQYSLNVKEYQCCITNDLQKTKDFVNHQQSTSKIQKHGNDFSKIKNFKNQRIQEQYNVCSPKRMQEDMNPQRSGEVNQNKKANDDLLQELKLLENLQSKEMNFMKLKKVESIQLFEEDLDFSIINDLDQEDFQRQKISLDSAY